MKTYLTSIAFISAFSLHAHAHHGTSGQFDATKVVEISGTITEMGYINPHSYVYFDVTNEDGSVTNWNCELRAASVMKRAGWTEDMFAPGTHVDIYGAASRKDPNGCYVETIAFNGGQPIERYANIETEKAAPPTNLNVKRTAWGVPDISGDWAAPVRVRGSIIEEAAERGPQEEERGPPQRGPDLALTDAGQAAYDKYFAYGIENPEMGRFDCQPRDIFADWVFDQHPNHIFQTEDEITLQHGFLDTVRTIDLTAKIFPSEPARWQGYSIGHWNGDELIVLSRGFTEALGRYGIRSEGHMTIERFSFNEEGTGLNRSYASADPDFWKLWQFRTGGDVVYPSNHPYEPYDCDDRAIE